MTVLLYDLPTDTPYPTQLVDLGVMENFETSASIGGLLDHVGEYVPGLRGLNVAEAGWSARLGSEKILNYTYGFGLLRDSVRASLVLDGMGADYVGAEPAGLFLSANKPHMSALMAAAGFRAPSECLVVRDLSDDEAEKLCASLGTELLVVKPAYEESSLGLSLVQNDAAALGPAVALVRELVAGPVLVQEYIDGVDVTVPVIGRRSPTCLPALVLTHEVPGEAPFVFDAAQKAQKSTVHYEPMDHWPAALRTEIYDMALVATRMAGVRDYSRLDCRISRSGHCYFLEINANPQLGLGKASFAVSARRLDLELGQVVGAVIGDDTLAYGTTPLGLGC